MRNRRWTLALNTTFIILVWVRPGWADQKLTVRVNIVNDANLANRTIDEALMIAAGVFRRAGVAVSWSDAPDNTSTEQLSIRITGNASDLPFRAADDSMGVVPGLDGARATVAYVFADRVRQFADRGRIDAWIVLGCAIAHELGHLLLPLNAHAADGIMRAHWDARMIARAGRFLSFAPDQAGLLRRRVASRVQAIP